MLIKVRISISVYFAAFIACILVLDNTGLAALALLCALIHECGHIAVLCFFRVPVEEVSFKLFGINIVLKNGTVLSYKQETILALAGSAANLFACVLTHLLYAAGIFPGKTEMFAVFNLVLGCFNLLPIGSLDGGQAVESALCRKISYDKAEKIVNITSAVFIIPLVFAGVYVIRMTGYNISLIVAAIYLASTLILNSGIIVRSCVKKLPNR